jgi:hypothetical protein
MCAAAAILIKTFPFFISHSCFGGRKEASSEQARKMKNVAI